MSIEINEIYNKVIDIYNKYELMPKSHLSILIKLKNDYGFEPKNIYDIGAAVLHWTRFAHKVFPNSNIYLFDAYEYNRIVYNDYKHFIGVLSDEDNKIVNFYQHPDNIGGNSYYKEIGHSKSIEYHNEDTKVLKKTYKLSTVVDVFKFNLPNLIKMDVQGAEYDIIKGSVDIITHADFLIMEIQHTDYNENAPKTNTVLPYILSLNFELVEVVHINGPDADYLFINKNSEYYNTYNNIKNLLS
jgi:FkbM family methyltransferase